MPKVILNKSTKIKGKGLFLAGVEVEVTADEEKQLKKDGFLGEIKKDSSPSNDKEIQELVAKVAKLEAQIAGGGGNTSELEEEITTLKSDIVTVEGSNNDLLLANKTLEEEITSLKDEIETLKNETPDLTAGKKTK